MALYRSVQMSFWTDSKIVDEFTPEDRYFYLYLMTNPHTNLAGCYELSLKQASVETGYTKEVITNLIARFEHVHNIICYSKTSKEVLLKNWSKFNWTSSEKFRKPLKAEIDAVKNVDFRRVLTDAYNGIDTVSTLYRDGTDTTVTVTDTVTVNKNSNNKTQNEVDFEVLWKLYPKKQGKQMAFKAYKKARKEGATFEEIKAGIEAYKDYLEAERTDMKYVAMGSTFFNQRRWQDDYTIRSEHDCKRDSGNDNRPQETDFSDWSAFTDVTGI